jgi:hypothetical protein
MIGIWIRVQEMLVFMFLLKDRVILLITLESRLYISFGYIVAMSLKDVIVPFVMCFEKVQTKAGPKDYLAFALLSLEF